MSWKSQASSWQWWWNDTGQEHFENDKIMCGFVGLRCLVQALWSLKWVFSNCLGFKWYGHLNESYLSLRWTYIAPRIKFTKFYWCNFLLQSRVSEAGHDGQAVMETIQSLPRSNIRHNDFSHLGINTATRDQIDLDDAISVISATASASIPYAQVSLCNDFLNHWFVSPHHSSQWSEMSCYYLLWFKVIYHALSHNHTVTS